MSHRKNLLITGANRGLGLGIANALSKANIYNVILSSRDRLKGIKALEELSDSHAYHETLDIGDCASIGLVASSIRERFSSRIDCLVNNAGVMYKPKEELSVRSFDFNFKTNFYDTVAFTERMLNERLIAQDGKIIFIGTSLSRLNLIKKKELAERFKSESLSAGRLIELSHDYREAILNGSVVEEGWSEGVYYTSKLFVNFYARILSKRRDILDRGIQVYSCCPGSVKTDMNDKGVKSLEQGAKTPIYLVNLDYRIQEDKQGQLFYNEKPLKLF